jgi:hypothetical protein
MKDEIKIQKSRIRKGYFITLFLIPLFIVFYSLLTSPVQAQVVDTTIWQEKATGLSTTSNTDQKTAGLMITVKASSVPTLNLQGGVFESLNRVAGPVGIELGEVKVSGTTPILISQLVDWAHNEMTFSENIKLWVSRMSPAVLIQSQNSSLTIFSGNVGGVVVSPSQWPPYPLEINNRTPSPSYPKWVAYSSGGNIQVRQLSSANIVLPALDNNWLLFWYGSNSHFAETKVPISFSDGGLSSVIPHSDAYLADAPMLLKFENNPTSIIQSPEGGIDLTFSTNSGYTSILPLYGREHLRASDTEGWGSSGTLPQEVIQKINFWTDRLCSYPTQVSETYSYDPNTDTSTITENITFLPVCSSGSTGTPFSILPPMMALTMTTPDQQGNTNPLNIQISGGTPINANYPTEFGPLLGLDNANSYSWSIAGLKKYSDSKRTLTNLGSIPSEVLQKLSSEVDKIVQAGHYQPWMFVDRLPHSPIIGDVYFSNPGDILYHLTEVVEVLQEPLKTNLINYLKSERNVYPPETVFNLPVDGTLRDHFAFRGTDPSNVPNTNWYQRWQNDRKQLFYKKVPLYNLYALSRYYQVTGENIPPSLIDQAYMILNQNMVEQDWASFTWFKGFGEKRVAVWNANLHLSGLIGYVQLAKALADIPAENLGRSLLAKALVSRISMAKYPRYLYSSGLTVLPPDPAWQPKYASNNWIAWGYIYDYNWTNSYDDHLQVTLQDQFGTYLYDSTGYMGPGGWVSSDWGAEGNKLAAYSDLVPEAFRVLTDYIKTDFEIYLKNFTVYSPQWYVAFAEAIIGAEHNLSYPTDSFQIFMAKAFLERDNAQNLHSYTSIPWLESGDFFYMHKLAETIKAYQGWSWEDELKSPSDISGDGSVSLEDALELFNNWFSLRNSNADIFKDNRVNGIDFSYLKRDWKP